MCPPRMMLVGLTIGTVGAGSSKLGGQKLMHRNTRHTKPALRQATPLGHSHCNKGSWLGTTEHHNPHCGGVPS
jgi:hypothetical protein